jgi:hypothetical protein
MGQNDVIDRHLHDAQDVLADLVGAELFEQCEHFPPAGSDLEWLNASAERRFKHTLSSLPGPDAAMVALLCNILDLEIDHDVDEVDRLWKGEAWRACCPTPQHKETLQLLWQMLLHHLEERAAQMREPFKRKDKHRAVQSLRARATRVQLVARS